MAKNSYERVQELFLEAIAVPEDERETWLASACGDDQALLKEVASLVALEAATRDPLEDAVVAQQLGMTQDHVSGGSNAAEILCPHCCNPIGLLVNTVEDDVTCGSCGGDFNLIQGTDNTLSAEAFQQIGRFELISRLGFGGFGTVWKARDPKLERTVAIKIPRRAHVTPEQTEHFFREAKAAAQLRHPNILPVHEIGQDDGTIFIVSDFIRGVSLADQLTGPMISRDGVVRLCSKVALALDHAHNSGVIHRDLKPSNIMVDPNGEPIIMDFGLAKRESSDVTISGDGHIMGTPSYMSPEQAMGEANKADRRADIYSLGVMLFRMLTGELPFRGNAQMQMHQRTMDDAPDPRALNNHIPRDLATICLKCLEREPGRRYSTAEEVAAELSRFTEGRPILARPVSRTEKMWRWMKRNPALSTAAVLTAFIAVVGPLVAWRIETQRRDLEALVEDRNTQIANGVQSQEKATEEISRLRDSLAALEGRAHPWNYWPPQNVHWFQVLLRQIHADHFETLAQRVDEAPRKTSRKAYGEYALGILSEAVADLSAAKGHFRMSINEFESLKEKEPENIEWPRLLANSHIRLARVLDMEHQQTGDTVDVSSGESTANLKVAKSLYAKLGEDEDSFTAKAGLLDITLRQSIHSGIEKATSQLDQAQRLSREIEKKLVGDLRGLVNATQTLQPLY